MTTVAIIQARMTSTRLPGKVLLEIGDRPALAWIVDAARRIAGVDRVVVATSDGPADDAVAAWCAEAGVKCHRGSEADVLSRFALAARAERADIVMRLTADCPFLDPMVAGQVLLLLNDPGIAYASNLAPPSWPDGLDCEAFRAAHLLAADAEATRPTDREHVTPFIRNNRHRFPAANVTSPLPGLSDERWTLDTPEDLAFLRAVAERLPRRDFSHVDVLRVLAAEPGLRALNAGQERNAGAALSLSAEKLWLERSYDTSKALQARAEAVIPLGSQTFSKSRIQFPENASPLCVTHGVGGRVWDADGNEFVDMINALMPVVLGYCDPDVDAAIRDQLTRGISFSLPTILETELAERLVRLIPCAEKVRFGKNGSDATSAAIRLARAFTGRERVALCGYHGWQDWYIGSTTRDKGVPGAVKGLTHKFPYNDPDALDALLGTHKGEFAAVIMEPMNAVEPKPGYLAAVKEIAHRHGALLVFDEIITGFRYAMGGAQSLFGITPDLAAFGKSMGNGMPISAVVGRADIMAEMEEIFFSGTFGGEALSLAAAIATIDKMERENVIDILWRNGQVLADGVTDLIARHNLGEVFSLAGLAPWKLVSIADHSTAPAMAIKTLFVTEQLRGGVLMVGSHNVNYSHTPTHLGRVLSAWDRTLGVIAEALAEGDVHRRLSGKVLEPIFKVR